MKQLYRPCNARPIQKGVRSAITGGLQCRRRRPSDAPLHSAPAPAGRAQPPPHCREPVEVESSANAGRSFRHAKVRADNISTPRPALSPLLIDTFDLKSLRTKSHRLAKQER